MFWCSKLIPTKVVINHPTPSLFDPTHSPRHLAITVSLTTVRDEPSEKSHVSRISEPCLKAAKDIREVCVAHVQCVSSHHVLPVALWHVWIWNKRQSAFKPNGLFIFHKSAFYGGVVSERDKMLNGFPGM